MPDLPPAWISARGSFAPAGTNRPGYVNTDGVVLTVSRVFPNNGHPVPGLRLPVFSGSEDDASVPYHLGSEIYRKSFRTIRPQ